MKQLISLSFIFLLVFSSQSVFGQSDGPIIAHLKIHGQTGKPINSNHCFFENSTGFITISFAIIVNQEDISQIPELQIVATDLDGNIIGNSGSLADLEYTIDENAAYNTDLECTVDNPYSVGVGTMSIDIGNSCFGREGHNNRLNFNMCFRIFDEDSNTYDIPSNAYFAENFDLNCLHAIHHITSPSDEAGISVSESQQDTTDEDIIRNFFCGEFYVKVCCYDPDNPLQQHSDIEPFSDNSPFIDKDNNDNSAFEYSTLTEGRNIDLKGSDKLITIEVYDLNGRLIKNYKKFNDHHSGGSPHICIMRTFADGELLKTEKKILYW